MKNFIGEVLVAIALFFGLSCIKDNKFLSCARFRKWIRPFKLVIKEITIILF
jgi:hypothetical protein